MRHTFEKLFAIALVTVVTLSGAAFAQDDADTVPVNVEITGTLTLHQTEEIGQPAEQTYVITVASAATDAGEAILGVEGKALKLTGANAALAEGLEDQKVVATGQFGPEGDTLDVTSIAAVEDEEPVE